MDKLRQKYLQKWLRAQQQPVKKLMRTNIALATLSSLILVAQTYFLATLLDKLIMQNVDRGELVPYFIALIITFALRAVILWLREKIGFKAGRLLRNHMRQKILDKSTKWDLRLSIINPPVAGQVSCLNKWKICITSIRVSYHNKVCLPLYQW